MPNLFNVMNGKRIEPCPETSRSVGAALKVAPVRPLAAATFEKISARVGIVEIDYPGAAIFSCFRVEIGWGADLASLLPCARRLAAARTAQHGYDLGSFAA
jgi:hypothetical protein